MFITTFQLSKLPVWKDLYSSTSVQEVWITIRSFRVYPKGFGQTYVFRKQPFVNRNKKCSDFGKKNYSGNGNSLCSNFGNNSAVTVVLN